jgi:ketosteroid isomerase-like protein
MDRADVRRWAHRYEEAWRSPGTDLLAELFSDDASYRVSPWAEPIIGVAALGTFWDDERDGPDEEFTMTSEVVAVDGDTSVLRVEVRYGGDEPAVWRDLWVLRFDESGRCRAFEEWPFAPEQPDGH